MDPGKRDWLVTVQDFTVVTDETGGEDKTWTDYVSAWAQVKFGNAQEKREAAQEGGVQSATFEFVRNTLLDAVTLSYRLWFMDTAWDITEVATLDRQTLRITAARAM
jgi:head-tail adaptor